MAFINVNTGDIDPDTLKEGMDTINGNFDYLESDANSEGASMISVESGTFIATDVQGALNELNSELGTPISDLQDQLYSIQAGYETIPEVSSIYTTTYTTTSSTELSVPTNNGTVRIWTSTPCFITFGATGLDAATTNDIPFVGGIEVIGLAATDNKFRIIGDTEDGTINIVGLANSSEYRLYTEASNTKVITYTDSSNSSVLPSEDGIIRVYNDTYCYCAFNTSVSTTTGFIIAPGLSKIVVPAAATNIAFIRHTTSGTAWVTGMASV